jgi:aspartyl/glutamyl-tRNA(Asn/Gln) amidotransferase C subunit
MISKEEVQNLAELARLKLSDAETTSLQNDISNILEYVGQVSAISAQQGETLISDIKVSPSASAPHNVMREDTPRLSDDILAGKEEALRAAFPKREGGYNVVRKIIQKDE